MGHGQELAQAQALLAEHGVVAVCGGAGSGKTTLAATIAHTSGLTPYWIELYRNLGTIAEVVTQSSSVFSIHAIGRKGYDGLAITIVK
jgi:ABC-type lipoprotein export system ATPase subunit